MKKIILLEVLLTVVIIAVLLFIGGELYGITLVSGIKKILISSLIFSSFLHLIFLAGLIMMRMALSSLITRGYFTAIGASYLNKSGWLIIVYSVLAGMRAVFSTLSLEHINQYMFYLTMLVAGLGLIVMSEIVHKGEELEKENKLTI